MQLSIKLTGAQIPTKLSGKLQETKFYKVLACEQAFVDEKHGRGKAIFPLAVSAPSTQTKSPLPPNGEPNHRLISLLC